MARKIIWSKRASSKLDSLTEYLNQEWSENCLSPLKDWTNYKNQISHIKFRENAKTKKTIYFGREA